MERDIERREVEREGVETERERQREKRDAVDTVVKASNS